MLAELDKLSWCSAHEGGGLKQFDMLETGRCAPPCTKGLHWTTRAIKKAVEQLEVFSQGCLQGMGPCDGLPCSPEPIRVDIPRSA